jgi:hypothetical protein
MKWGGGCTDTTIRKKERDMKKVLVLLLCLFVGDSFATGISGGTTAPCDNDTLSKYTGTANVEINWEPNTINLNWYNGDEKLTVANNSQSCVYDGTLTVPTQPTKPGYTFNGWKVIKVPGGFTELEYIEATGTQWIDTGIMSGLDIQTRAKFGKTANTFTRYGLIVAANLNYQALVSRLEVDSYYSSLYNSTSGYASHGVTSNSAAFEFTFNTSEHKVIVEGTSYDLPIIANFESAGIKIFFWSGHDTQYAGIGRLYYVELKNTQTNTILFNGIPARRNSDGVLGMYDSITGQFFTNQGTGDFIAGPVVQ